MGSPEAESTGAGREGETAAGPRPKKARRGSRAPHPLPNQRKAMGGGQTEKPRGMTSSEDVRRVRVWCLLAPSRGGAPLLGETWSAD